MLFRELYSIFYDREGKFVESQRNHLAHENSKVINMKQIIRKKKLRQTIIIIAIEEPELESVEFEEVLDILNKLQAIFFIML